MTQAALCQRLLTDALAQVNTPLAALGGQTGLITCAEFIGQAQRLAAQLPDSTWVINLCENRYLFMLAFCAAILRGQTNLLPQNRAPATLEQLAANYPGAYILHQGLDALPPGIAAHNMNQESLVGEAATAIPGIPLDQLAAIAFTSGSTGQPKPNPKSWNTFIESSRINAQHMLPGEQATLYELATVPPQHMWGLETSVLLPLFAPVCAADAKPLFPQDVQQALSRLPEPRLLVSTPVHLRALTQSGIHWPTTTRVLCATAPLAPSLAQDVEQQFGGDLIEVFGCSEVGSMACRQTAIEDDWQLFSGLHFVNTDVLNAESNAYQVQADHLPDTVPLQDLIAFTPTGRFRLLGRNEDMLEIAGKRGSLQELNHILLTTPGVLDGVVFLPDDKAQGTCRPVALAVIDTTQTDKAKLLARFAEHLDPVFIPRPLVLVDKLPREENGKLPRRRLLGFWGELRD